MLGRVLVVENRTEYAEEACRKLKALGCEVTSVPDLETIKKARENADKWETIVLRAVQSALEKDKFDVIVINLHLKDESGHLLYEGDFLGEKVLRHVTENYPGISCIVCTAHPPGRSAHFFLDRYNVADIIYKNAIIPARTDYLCDATKEVLTKGHRVRKKIGERWYELTGVNSQIYRFLHNNDIMSQVSSGIENSDNRLIKALGGDLLDERVGEATSLMADLWHLEAGLPRYPLIYKLGEMEFGRAFWEGHRDHLIHQLLVYLLGLYLYYGSDQLRGALSADMSEVDFLRAWKIAALFHDLGYVFEVEFEKKGKVYDQAFVELNDLRKKCLYHYFTARGISILEAEDYKIRHHGGIFVPEVNSKQIRTLSYFVDEDLFLPLEPQAQKAHLGETEDSLRRYWEYAMSHWTQGPRREGYVDHGIAGALVLLQQYRSLKHYLEKAICVIQRSSRLVARRTAGLIANLASQIAEYQSAVEAAASAIALHYIDVDNWDRDDAFTSQSLTLNQFCLSLQGTPFAFFLALVDILQSWDRPRYTMPKGLNYVMQAQDVAIGFRDGKIIVTYKTDPYRGTLQSIFARMLEQMSHYMWLDDLRVLLEEGDQS